MTIDDLDLVGVTITPNEANAELSIDSNRILAETCLL
jgi:hypothetical protein